MNIQQSLSSIKQSITTYEKKYSRTPGSVQLLAASKSQSPKKIKNAILSGQHCFGENYLQEALDKIMLLGTDDIEWHFIGSLQRNKTKKIAEYFSWVQSLNDMQLAKRLNDQRPSHLPQLNICIEVNISHEASKTGIEPAALHALAKYCLNLPKLCLRGIMVIPEFSDDFAKQRDIFHQAYILFKSLQRLNHSIDTLSMGMTHDFEAAIAEGATMVRIGTGIFGSRIVTPLLYHKHCSTFPA